MPARSVSLLCSLVAVVVLGPVLLVVHFAAGRASPREIQQLCTDAPPPCAHLRAEATALTQVRWSELNLPHSGDERSFDVTLTKASCELKLRQPLHARVRKIRCQAPSAAEWADLRALIGTTSVPRMRPLKRIGYMSPHFGFQSITLTTATRTCTIESSVEVELPERWSDGFYRLRHAVLRQLDPDRR
jgi:hypothetical protein